MSSKKENQHNEQQQNIILRGYAIFSHIRFTIPACIFAGIFFGKLLDNRFGTAPWLLLLFSLLGIASAVIAVYHLAKGYKQITPEKTDIKSELENILQEEGD